MIIDFETLSLGNLGVLALESDFAYSASVMQHSREQDHSDSHLYTSQKFSKAFAVLD